jgi:hypothetical protein
MISQLHLAKRSPMAKIALRFIIYSDQAWNDGPPTSTYTGYYATNQTLIPVGGVVPHTVPPDVQDDWLNQGLVIEA